MLGVRDICDGSKLGSSSLSVGMGEDRTGVGRAGQDVQ